MFSAIIAVSYEKNTKTCYQALKANLPFDDRRLQLLAALLVALFQLKTVNLTRLANILDVGAKPESKYRRLKRFFADYSIDAGLWAQLIIKLLDLKGRHILAIDRTLWQFGTTWVNILTLSLVVGNTSVPLFWKVLWHRGNSNLCQKTALLDCYIAVFGVSQVAYLCGDREFDSIKLVEYLERVEMKFRLRIRSSQPITDKHGKPMAADKLLWTMPIGTCCQLRRRRKYGAARVSIEVYRGKTAAESLIVISSCGEAGILADYKRRWAIETLFENLKSRGFELESTRLTDPERVGRLFGILALATAWAIKTGELATELIKVEIKKHGRQAKSVFRIGCELIQAILFEVKTRAEGDIWSILRC